MRSRMLPIYAGERIEQEDSQWNIEHSGVESIQLDIGGGGHDNGIMIRLRGQMDGMISEGVRCAGLGRSVADNREIRSDDLRACDATGDGEDSTRGGHSREPITDELGGCRHNVGALFFAVLLERGHGLLVARYHNPVWAIGDGQT